MQSRSSHCLTANCLPGPFKHKVQLGFPITEFTVNLRFSLTEVIFFICLVPHMFMPSNIEGMVVFVDQFVNPIWNRAKTNWPNPLANHLPGYWNAYGRRFSKYGIDWQETPGYWHDSITSHKRRKMTEMTSSQLCQV